jgi:hypothetical protein
MLREVINADIGTDVDDVVSRLQAKCAGAGMAPISTDLLVQQTREVLSTLIEQGKRISALGSQMSVTRDLTGDGYAIRLTFGAGQRPGFFKRLVSYLGGR